MKTPQLPAMPGMAPLGMHRSYEDRHAAIASSAYSAVDGYSQQRCSDAATFVYLAGISDADWLAATLKRLGGNAMTSVSHRLFLPWRTVQNHRGRIAIVDSRNNGHDATSGRVCNLPQGKDGRGLFIAQQICAAMNGRITRGTP